MLSRVVSISLICCFLAVYGGCGETTQDTTTIEQSTSTIPTASAFIFPVRGKTIIDITKNTADPRNDGWKVGNFYGHWCDNCGKWRGFHPGEDWNLVCSNGGGSCDFGEPVYAVADGLVTYAQKYPGEDIGDAIVIEHQLPGEEDLSKYIFPGTIFPSTENPINRTIESGYLHLQNLQVSKGQVVKKGDLIAAIGFKESPHLHFEIRWKTGNTIFAGYKTTQQALTDRGLLVPTAFISAHTDAPFVFVPMEGWNPSVCKNQPGKSDIDSSLVCQKTTTAPLGATIWGAVQLDRMRRTTCLSTAFLKDGLYQYSSPATCLTASDTAMRERTVFWTRTTPPTAGTWRIDYLTGETEYSLKKLTESTFMVNTVNATPPPPPPRPIDQTFYVFAGIKHTCDRPLIKDAWWSEYRCGGSESFSALGSTVYGLVKIHYVAPNIRYRFVHELYYNGKLEKTIDTLTWVSSGWYGQSEAYSFFTIDQTTLGRLPDSGTWTIRSLIVIDEKFTNWITDQTVTVF